MATAIPNNQCSFTSAEILQATGATFHGNASPAGVTSVSTDTRTLPPGALFVALKGERFDGHSLLSQAKERGAAAALVHRGTIGPEGLPLFCVEDTLVALGALAHHHLQRARNNRSLPVIAVGGAAGKTTTKELVAALLDELSGPVLATKGNLNNRIGVPMTLFTLTDAHRSAVIECGTNTRGEIEALGLIVKPDVALVLNADVEHTEGLGTLEAVRDEEACLFGHASKASVTSTTEPGLQERMHRAHKHGLLFGEGDGAHVRLHSRQALADGSSRLHLVLHASLCASRTEETLSVDTALLGRAAATNITAALCATIAALGENATKEQLDRASKALQNVRPVPGRLTPIVRGETLLLDDSYNANPGSVRAAIETAGEIAQQREARLVLLLGDMLELGSFAPSMHEEIAQLALAQSQQFHGAFAVVGPAYAAALDRLAIAETIVPRFAKSIEARAWLETQAKQHTVVLLKGSRGIALEHALAALQ